MVEKFIGSLRQALSPKQVSDDTETLARHCKDYKGYNIGTALAVVFPSTVEEVASVIGICQLAKVLVTPQGGNTSGYGGAVPNSDGRSIVLSLARMNRILEVDLSNNTALVEAGCVLGDLNRKLAEMNRWFPMSFGSEDSCQIGGNIAMNSGGNMVMRYGMTRENILGIEAVLGNGKIFSSLQQLRKKSIGYDLGQLLIGSEGTLGVVTKAVLKLQPLQTAKVTAWAACATLEGALEVLDALRSKLGDRLIAFEVISKKQREIISSYLPDIRDPVGGDYEWAILFECGDTSDPEGLRQRVETALGTVLFDRELISNAVIAANEAQRTGLWAVREAVLDANKAYGWPVSHDASVPVSKLPEFAKRVESTVKAVYPRTEFIAAGHAGDGNIHLGVVFEKSEFSELESFRKTTRRINEMVYEIAADLGGHFASEHGIGVQHVNSFQRYTPKATIETMLELKKVLDPSNIMNPGKIFG